MQIEIRGMKMAVVQKFFFTFLVASLVAGQGGLSAESWQRVPIGKVEVGGEIGRRIAVTIDANLLALDLEKDFLGPLATRDRQDGYVAVGKLLDAAVRFAAYRGDERVVSLKNRLVERIVSLQQPDGYIGIMAPERRLTSLWDIHEMGYLIYGLLSDYEFFGEQRSLQAARSLGDYIVAHWPALPENWGSSTGVATSVAVTGLERSLLRLNRQTGEEKFLDFCVRTRALPQWDPAIVIGRRPLIEGHIYAYLCRSLAQLELYSIRPDESLLQPTRQAIKFMTERDGMAITGGCGQWEIWTEDQDVRGELGETCATAYQLRVFDQLLRMTGDAKLGDLMERTLYNALFAAQSPDGAQIRYYAPLEGPRAYFELQNYCCPANYRRIIAELRRHGLLPGRQGSHRQSLYAVAGRVTAGNRRDREDHARDRLPQFGKCAGYVSRRSNLRSSRCGCESRPGVRRRECGSTTKPGADRPEAGSSPVVERTWKDGDCHPPRNADVLAIRAGSKTPIRARRGAARPPGFLSRSFPAQATRRPRRSRPRPHHAGSRHVRRTRSPARGSPGRIGLHGAGLDARLSSGAAR